MSKTVIIGSGFSGLACASLLAKSDHEVLLLEKNDSVGGRARKFEEQGFVFDMGPSWYWMPDVFERFFGYFDKKPEDYFELVKLDPAFRIFFPDETKDLPGNAEDVYDFFESLEPGSTASLKRFMKEAEFKYEVGVKDIIYRQPEGIKPFLNWRTISASFRLQLVTSISKHISKYFSHPYLKQLLEFPVLFLGADPKDTPALYSLMDYSGFMQGTWYPKGGFHEVIEGMRKLAIENGVEIKTETMVKGLQVEEDYCHSVITSDGNYACDSLVASGDYHHFDQHIVPAQYRQYNAKYWDSRSMAPSTLLYYIGHRGEVDGLLHHNLFFDADFAEHSKAIYKTDSWPDDPLFYVCAPSKTDPTVAPNGHENLFILIPIAPGLRETEDIQELYFQKVAERILAKTGFDIRPGIVYRRNYSTSDFIKDYNAFKGNAYGLANTLAQTAFLKPRMRHKKLKNVFHCGHLTVPGPGVPPAIVSGELAANYVNSLNEKAYA